MASDLTQVDENYLHGLLEPAVRVVGLEKVEQELRRRLHSKIEIDFGTMSAAELLALGGADTATLLAEGGKIAHDVLVERQDGILDGMVAGYRSVVIEVMYRAAREIAAEVGR